MSRLTTDGAPGHDARALPSEPPAPLLSMTGIRKSFGGVQAVADGWLEISTPGVVHALMGTNGSGKSTMLKILAGIITADRGDIRLSGERVDFSHPGDAVRHGVAMVSQETAVVPELSVAENVLLGRLPGSRFGVDWKAAKRDAAAILTELGLEVDVDRTVASLRPDQRQIVEIARAIGSDARLLILDEPTSSLAEDRVADLHRTIRRLAGAGVSIVLVSHRLDEIFDLADELTIMRDGSFIESGPTSAYTVASLVHAMTGGIEGAVSSGQRAADSSAGDSPASAPPTTGCALRLTGLTGDAFHDISIEVAPGEIVGVAGLDGSGRSEVLAAAFGAIPSSSGSVELAGADVTRLTPRGRIAAGLGYLPPDRKTQGLVLPLSGAINLSLASSAQKPGLSLVNRRRDTSRFREIQKLLRLRAASPSTAVVSLSGGNQQKIALGKWLGLSRVAVMLDEPTRGVDVAAKADIHAELTGLAARGIAVLVSSSESQELLELCSRIVVLFRGRVIAVESTQHLHEHRLTELTGGHL